MYMYMGTYAYTLITSSNYGMLFQNSIFLYLSLASNLYFMKLVGMILLLIWKLNFSAHVTIAIHVYVYPMLTAGFYLTDHQISFFISNYMY